MSVDYLLGLTNNRKYENTPIEELHLSDEVVELLKSERFNNRLLCEIISHEKFKELLADAEIYVDGMATMRFHDMNSSLAAVRAMILEGHPEAVTDRVILSRLVDTFFSRISLTKPPASKSHNTAYVLPWEEPLHWQSRSSGCSSS